MERNEIIKNLLNKGAVQVKGLKVESVNVDVKDTYTNIGIKLNKPIKGFLTDDGGVTFEEKDTNMLYISAYQLSGILKAMPEVAFLGQHVIKVPTSPSVLLPGATINIIQEKIEAGTPYINPFTTVDNPEPTEFEHDLYINYITDIKFGESGNECAKDVRKFMLLGTI